VTRQKAACLFLRICVPLLCLVLGSALRADYMPFSGAAVAPNIAEVRIGPDGIHVQLEIFIEDIAVFEALIPDAWMSQTPANRPGAAERLADFSETGLSIRRDDGTVLPVAARLIEPRMRIDRAPAWAGKQDPITGQYFSKPPDDKRVVFAELFYDFQDAPPDAITISPPSDDTGKPTVTIGIVVFDRAVPATKFSFLSADARLVIDWSDPWYSKFDSPNLKRHHQSAITTFLYVEPREVRHETLIRVRDLQDWTDLGLNAAAMMDANAQQRVKTAARAFLADRNPVTIDGLPVTPTSTHASFLSLSDVGLQIVENERELDPFSTFVGVILSFPVPTLPDSVIITWDMFNSRVNRIPATATDPAGPFFSGATPDSPVIDWTNFLRTYQEPWVLPVTTPNPGLFQIPLMSLLLIAASAVLAGVAVSRLRSYRPILIGVAVVCIGAAVVTRHVAVLDINNPLIGPPDPQTSAVIFSAILDNLNTANLETDRPERARHLQTLVVNESMKEVVSELDRALAIQVVGGGAAKIRAIEDVMMKDISDLAGGNGFRSLAEWTARANAGHWGHNHKRNLRYRALVEVQWRDNSWKLAGITVVDIRDAK
jgi:hypothetical protein